ncbi:hypothetical protein CEE55_05470 [Stenotrophomonas pavanii]|uniref:Uncharacterized protein n=1 Tax=Stenotrophomonas pavanii TaxID=487698 RepID=A0A246L1F7_9GAMM|nr:hypothetical protein CEE55_05470 [Stenotrophomonas pavanii]
MQRGAGGVQHGPGRDRRGGEGSIGRSDTMGVHVTERDVMVLLTGSDQGQIRFPQENGADPAGNAGGGRSML